MSVPLHPVQAPRGMVTSVDHLASTAGVSLLAEGGSAIDAAIGANAVLAVTTQHMCGLGGDLFALVSDGSGPPLALNASGRAGSGADPDRLRAEGHRQMPARHEVRSAPVPGVVDGWIALHRRGGELPLSRVLAPAIELAENGFPLTPLLVEAVAAVADLPGAADYRAPGRARLSAPVRRLGVAATLRQLAEGGREAVFGGDYGRDLLELGGGEYSEADLASVQADWVRPLSIEAWGHRIWTPPPNSQGYVALLAAALACEHELSAHPDDEEAVHLLVEAAKLAGHDRPDRLWEGADGEALVAGERIERLGSRIGPRALSLPTPADRGDTVYLAAVDGRRRAVSLIQSNAAGWGSHLVLPRTRIFLHNRGIGFSLEPGHPAEYGPGRRPPHTLAPTLVTDLDDALVACVGTMGGDAQPQILLQILARVLAAGQDPATAVAAGRWVLSPPGPSGFDTWTDPSRIEVGVEDHSPDNWASALAARGHRVRSLPAWSSSAGHAHVIAVGAEGELLAAADPRALTGSAAGH